MTKRDKYIWFDESGTEQYFDLIQDPDELHDRIGDPACQDRIAKLRAELIRRLAGRPEGYSDGEKLYPEGRSGLYCKIIWNEMRFSV